MHEDAFGLTHFCGQTVSNASTDYVDARREDQTMHTFMDAKLMAKLLRQALAEREVYLTHSDCLELVAKQYNLANWNILSAKIESIAENELLLPEGWMRAGGSPRFYRLGLDRKIGAALIENLPEYGRLTADDYCTMMQSVSAKPYLGQRIRFEGELRTEDAIEGGTIWMRIDGNNARNLRFDNLQMRPDAEGAIRGTTDWTRRDIVFNVPEEAASIHFGFFLKGTGRCWARNFSLETVDSSVPMTGRQTKFLPSPINLDFRLEG